VLYNILIEFGIPVKLVRLIKTYLNETCSGVRVGKHLSGMIPFKNGLKQRDALLPLKFSFALNYVCHYEDSGKPGWLLKLNCIHQRLVYVDDVNILNGRVHTLKKNTIAFTVASKKTELEVNTDKTKYMIMS
jgi:hypothetical protein